MYVNNPKSTISVDEEIRQQRQLGLDLQELERSEAYNRVIGGYLNSELIEATEDMLTQGPSRQEALERVMSIGYFKLYLQRIKNDAETAADELSK